MCMIGSTLVTEESSIKYLRVVLDSRLTWASHVKYIAGRAFGAVNILKVMSRVSWRADPVVLLTSYRGFIRAILE